MLDYYSVVALLTTADLPLAGLLLVGSFADLGLPLLVAYNPS
jgi:hypothetical protein